MAVSVRQGFPVLSLPLPSRRENCEFVVRPYLQTVGDFVMQLSHEDNGIERYVDVVVWLLCGQLAGTIYL